MLTPIAFPPTIPLTHLPRGVVTLYPVEVEASVVSRLEKALEEKVSDSLHSRHPPSLLTSLRFLSCSATRYARGTRAST
jgi:hypothetical protein